MYDATDLFRVVINNELQFALIPDAATTPAGWTEAGFSAGQEDCMAWVDLRWTDQRPARLRG